MRYVFDLSKESQSLSPTATLYAPSADILVKEPQQAGFSDLSQFTGVKLTQSPGQYGGEDSGEDGGEDNGSKVGSMVGRMVESMVGRIVGRMVGSMVESMVGSMVGR